MSRSRLRDGALLGEDMLASRILHTAINTYTIASTICMAANGTASRTKPRKLNGSFRRWMIVMATTVFVGIMTQLGILLSDITYSLVDPRIRHE